MCPDFDISIAYSGDGNESKPEAVLKVGERIGLDGHMGFHDAKGDRKEDEASYK